MHTERLNLNTDKMNEPQAKKNKLTLKSILKDSTEKATNDTSSECADRGLTLEDKVKQIKCYLQFTKA